MALQVNPMELIKMIKSGQNPQQLLMSILEQSAMTSPMGANLLSLAKENKTSDIERIARNIAKEKGLDFDAEFNAFKEKIQGSSFCSTLKMAAIALPI